MMDGLYLVSPHGSLIYSGEKTSIATGKRYPITGTRLVCSQENGAGLAFGVAQIGDPAVLDPASFDTRVSSHQVTRSNRRKWWPDADQLYDYPILRFDPFPQPVPVQIEPGTTLDMGPISHPGVQEAVKSLEGGIVTDPSLLPLTGERPGFILPEVMSSELVTSQKSDKIMSTSQEEGEMPWTVNDPPPPSKNWTADEKKKCVAAANAVIRDDPKDEQGAIFACIRAAGKTQHPGGKKEVDPEDYVIAEELVKGYLSVKAGDMGDGDTHTCTCPNCGTQSEKDSPCREETCPKCGAHMRGGDEDTESKEGDEGGEVPLGTAPSGDTQPPTEDLPTLISSLPTSKLAELRETLIPEARDSPIVRSTLETIEGEMAERGDKAGRRINSSILDKLKKIYNQLKEVLDFGDGTDKQDAVAQIVSQIGKSYAFKSYGDDWFGIWPTNSYQDREKEFFTSKTLSDFVDRYESNEIKGAAWFWHTPGSKFGTIYQQAIVEDHFLFQLGKYDDTDVGRAFKAFFAKYPDGHPVIAPWGWGASHGYAYDQADRERDGTYNWVDIKESSVLPVHHAANVHNPRPYFQEVKMNDKQKEAFAAIGEEIGVPDLVDRIVSAARAKKEELDGKVQHKSVEPDKKKPEDEDEDEQVPEEKKDSLAPQLTPEVVNAIVEKLLPTVGGLMEGEEKSHNVTETDDTVTPDISTLTKEIVDALHLNELSDVLTSLKDEVKEVKDRLGEVEQSDREKVEAAAKAAPQFSWWAASQADETVQSDKGSPSTAAVPDAVKAIAGRIEDAI